MASEEHKYLAQFLKNVHSTLRNNAAVVGAEKAWSDHCLNKNILSMYASYMEKLATTHWELNSSNELSSATSRIKWSADFCYDYFCKHGSDKYYEKEKNIGNGINIEVVTKEIFLKPYKLLDVGSCYNPFKVYDFLDVLAIDLCPANDSVKECDFLNVSIATDTIIDGKKVIQLQENYFDIITFCFLLEYIPSSELRILACNNAYKLLKVGGVLIINTPDSKHVGANSKLMKNWRYSLAMMGFSRIKYEKYPHMHCMAFRKSLHRDIAARWAILYKEPFMDGSIHIPQDFNKTQDDFVKSENITFDVQDLKQLPFVEFD